MEVQRGGRAYIKVLQSYGLDIDTIFDSFENEEKTEFYKIIHPTQERIKKYEMIIVTQETFYEEIERDLNRMNYLGKIKSMECFISDLKKISLNK